MAIKLLILSIIISSCAWNQKEFGEEILKEPIPTSSSTTDPAIEEDLAKEFKVEEKSETTTVSSPAPEIAISKPVAVKMTKKKITKGGKTVTATAPTVISDYSLPIDGKLYYPENHPDEMKKWDSKNRAIWDSFKLCGGVGEETFLDVSYLGMTIGKIFINVKPDAMVGGREAHHYYVRLKSAPFYKFAYKLDDYVESFVQKSNYIPLKFSLIQRESSKDIDNIELFDSKRMMGHLRYKKVQDGKTEKESKDFPIPHLYQDSLSAFFFLRGLPLNVGDVFDFPLSTKDKITIFSVKVIGKETIDTAIGKRKSIKMYATTRYSGEMVEKGQSEIWFSDDSNRAFLKLKAKTKIGAIDASIVEYRPGK